MKFFQEKVLNHKAHNHSRYMSMKKFTIALLLLWTGNIFGQAPSLQTHWDMPNGPINALAEDTLNNRIYLGGLFDVVTDRYKTGGLFLDTSNLEIAPQFPDFIQNINQSNEKVMCSTPDGMGGWYIGGRFTQVGDSVRNNLVHIDQFGVVTDWYPTVDGIVELIEKKGNAIYISGVFTQVNQQQRLSLAAIDSATGNLLPWNPGTSTLCVQNMFLSDSAMYLVQQSGYASMEIQGQSRSLAAAIDLSTGNLLPFNPTATIQNINGAQLKGDTLFISGSTNFQNPYGIKAFLTGTGLEIPYGSLFLITHEVRSFGINGNDFYHLGTRFQGTPGLGVFKLDMLTNISTPFITLDTGLQVNQIFIAGEYLFITGNFDEINGQPRRNIAAFDLATGALSPLLVFPTVGSNFFKTISSSGGRLFIGGAIRVTAGNALTTASNLAVLDVTTGRTISWPASVRGGWVQDIKLVGDTLIIAGDFDRVNGQLRQGFAMLEASTGSLIGPMISVNGIVYDLHVFGNRVYLGGAFTAVSGAPRTGIAAIELTTGSLSSFAPQFSWSSGTGLRINKIKSYQGRLFVGGHFVQVNGVARSGMVELDPITGSVQPFNPTLSVTGNTSSPYVIDMDVLGDDLFFAGFFNDLSGQARSHFASINLTTAAPNSWSTQAAGFFSPFSNTILGVTATENKILIRGGFSDVNGFTRPYLAAVDPTDGYLLGWNISPNGRVNKVLKSDHVLYVGGIFSEIIGVPRPYFAVISDSSGVCPTPPDVITDSITKNSFLIRWTSFGIASATGGASQWLVEIDTNGFNSGIPLASFLTSKQNFKVENFPSSGGSGVYTLQPGEVYSYRVRAICNTGDTSDYSQVGMVTLLYDCENSLQSPDVPHFVLPGAANSINTSTGCLKRNSYSVLTNIEAGEQYRVEQFSAFITVREGARNGPVIASGFGEVDFSATTSQDVYVHWNTDIFCGVDSIGCIYPYVSCLSCEVTYLSEDFSNGLGVFTPSGPQGNLWYRAVPQQSHPVSRRNYSMSPVNREPLFYNDNLLIQSNSVQNGFAMIDMDAFNSANGNPTSNPISAFLTSPPMNLSQVTGQLVLTFDYALRYCCASNAQFLLQISGDNFITSQSLIINGNLTLNSPRIGKINQVINGFINNLPNKNQVRVRLSFANSPTHYFWMIDDFRIYEIRRSDARLVTANYTTNATTNPNGILTDFPYTIYDTTQVRPFRSIATISNAGGQALTNARVELQVTGPANYDSTFVSTIKQLSVNGQDTVSFPEFTLPQVPGIYNLKYQVLTDQQDSNTSNDTIIKQVIVSDSVFAADQGETAALGVWTNTTIGGANSSGNYLLGNRFEITKNARITGISARIASGSEVGRTIKALVLDGSAIVAQKNYVIQPNDTNNWVHIPFDTAFEAVSGNIYTGGIQYLEEGTGLKVYINFAGTAVPQQSRLLTQDNNGNYFTNVIPLIRLNMAPEPCSYLSNDSLLVVEVCDSFNYRNQTLTESGVYVDTLANIYGCDSIVTLELSIIKPIIITDTVFACVDYTWPINNAFYDSTGVYTDTQTAISGCDSIHILHLFLGVCCDMPDSLDVRNSTMTSANLTWVDHGLGYQWQLEWGPAGFLPGGGLRVDSANSPFALTGLSPGTSYEFYVRALCTDGDTTAWSDPRQFYTLIGHELQIVTGLPGVSGGIAPAIHAIEVDSLNNRVLLGGNFTHVGPFPRASFTAIDLGSGGIRQGTPNVQGGTVYSLLKVGNTIYMGGSFTSVNGQPRNRLAAFDAQTFSLKPWNPSADNIVFHLAEKDGVIYIGGMFEQINGLRRPGVAALDSLTGTMTTWGNSFAQTDSTYQVHKIALVGNNMYVAGIFTHLGGAPRKNAACLDLQTGAATMWQPEISMYTMDVMEVDGFIYMSGLIDSVDSVAHKGLVKLDTLTGAIVPWDVVTKHQLSNSLIKGFTKEYDKFFVHGGFSEMAGVNRPGMMSVDISTGGMTTWDPQINGTVNTTKFFNNTLFVGGQFNQASGQTRQNFAVYGLQLNCPEDLGRDVVNISGLPYFDSGATTCGSGNNLNGAKLNSCNQFSDFMGEDKVYIFSPEMTDTFLIQIYDHTDWANMTLYEDCPLILQNGVCIDRAAGFGPQNITAQLDSGKTYYLIVNGINCFSYDLSIQIAGRPHLAYSPSPTFDTAHGVSPQAGLANFIDPQSAFEYRVVYSHPNNVPPIPGYPIVGVDSTGNGAFDFLVSMTEVDTNDQDYTNGKEYFFIRGYDENYALQYAFMAIDTLGKYATGAATQLRSGPIVYADSLDLFIYASDITFSDNNPPVNTPVDITVVVHNQSFMPANNVPVHIYDGQVLIDSIVIPAVGPRTSAQFTISRTFAFDGYYPIRVEIDKNNTLQENNRLNNTAIRPITVGNFSALGSILVTLDSIPQSLCPGTYILYRGTAKYSPEFGNNIPVAGGEVIIQILPTGQLFKGRTNSNGRFAIPLRTPTNNGTYSVAAQVIDFTVSGTSPAYHFSVSTCPAVPNNPNPSGGGSWNNSWPPINNTPGSNITFIPLKAELEVRSAFIAPSKINPNVGEFIQVVTSLENKGNIPANNFFVQFEMDSIPLGSPVFVPRLFHGFSTAVQATDSFASPVPGYHTIRVTLDPDGFVDELNLNNNVATRGVIVGNPVDLAFRDSLGLFPSDFFPSVGKNITINAVITNSGNHVADAEIHYFLIHGNDTTFIDSTRDG
jgi:hypothetical protein